MTDDDIEALVDALKVGRGPAPPEDLRVLLSDGTTVALEVADTGRVNDLGERVWVATTHVDLPAGAQIVDVHIGVLPAHTSVEFAAYGDPAPTTEE